MECNELVEFREQWKNEISSTKSPQENEKDFTLSADFDSDLDKERNCTKEKDKNESKSFYMVISKASNSSAKYLEDSDAETPKSRHSSSSSIPLIKPEPQDMISLLINYPGKKKHETNQLRTNPISTNSYFKDFSYHSEHSVDTDCNRTKHSLTNCKARDQLLQQDGKQLGTKKQKFCKDDNSSKERHIQDYSENLVDQLISDIDEITSIPFFDIEIPREVAVKIFSQLSLQDLGHCACTSKSWQNLAEDELIWYQLCVNLGYETGVESVLDRSEWKEYVKDCVFRDRNNKRNWRERICLTSDLEYERGGIICAAHLDNNLLITGYVTGEIKLWDVSQRIVVKSLETTHDDMQTKPMVTCASVSGDFCAAGFENGDINVWHPTHQTSPLHQYQCYGPVNHVSMVTSGSHPIIVSASGDQLRVDTTDSNGAWFTCENKTLTGRVDHVKPIPNMKISGLDPHIAFSLKDSIQIMSPGCDSTRTLEQISGSKMTALDCTHKLLLAGVAPYGYGVIGYKARLYCLQTNKLLNLFPGHTREITCINLAQSPHNFFVSGCRDRHVRIYDMRSDVQSVMLLRGHNNAVTSVQMDEWKVVSGSVDGSICVWDQRMSSLLWETSARHPVHICQYHNNILTTVNIPIDKNPQNNLWYADDLVQHRRHRGHVRVYDFDADHLTMGVPDICLSTYDDRAGYNYNINLMVPYDQLINAHK